MKIVHPVVTALGATIKILVMEWEPHVMAAAHEVTVLWTYLARA
jgi:hypothetical protein